jgi:hypothetical protein
MKIPFELIKNGLLTGIGLTLGYVAINYVARNLLKLSYPSAVVSVPSETHNSLRPVGGYQYAPGGIGVGAYGYSQEGVDPYNEHYRGRSTPPPSWAGSNPRKSRVAYRYSSEELSDTPVTSGTPTPPHSGVMPYKDFATGLDIYSGDPQASSDLIEDPELQQGSESKFNFEYDNIPNDIT